MKKSIILLILLSIFFSIFNINTYAAFTDQLVVEPDIAYVKCLDENHTIIYDKNSDKKVSPGATIKIVTALLAIEKCADLDEVVTAKQELVRSLDGTGCTIAGILVDEEITVRELLYCLLLYNANDAAVILADHTSGSVNAFVEEMNSFASQIGCRNTHFTDPNGFESPDQYTTASDLALIFEYCMKNSIFADIISNTMYEMEPTNKYTSVRYLKTTCGLMNYGIPDYYFKYVEAGKSGTTENDRCNSVSLASKDGYSYICVVLDAPMRDYDEDDVDENMAFVTSRHLYEWVFDTIKLRTVANTTTYVGEIKVIYSKEYDYISLVPSQEVSALVPYGANEQGVLIEIDQDTVADVIKAPVKKGDKLAEASIKYAGQEIARVDLVAAFDIKGNFFKIISYTIGKIVSSTIFKISAISITLIAVFLIILLIRNSKNYKSKGAK